MGTIFCCFKSHCNNRIQAFFNDIILQLYVNSTLHKLIKVYLCFLAPQISTREMSARTQRAKKMHDAHLRSMGLGQYTPSDSGLYISPGEEQDKDDDF